MARKRSARKSAAPNRSDAQGRRESAEPGGGQGATTRIDILAEERRIPGRIVHVSGDQTANDAGPRVYSSRVSG
jgi:hypothetical protein